MNKKKVWILILFTALGFILANSNYRFSIELIEEGTWEAVEVINGIQDLNFAPSDDTGDYYLDYSQSPTYGSYNWEPPAGMGQDDTTDTDLIEGSYSETTYPDKTIYTGGSLPSGWTNSNWAWGSTYTTISGFAYSSGYFYTNTHDMSSYIGVRVRFSWRNIGNDFTEASDLESISYEGSSIKWWESPQGNSGWTNQQRDSAWHSTGWYCRWNADSLDGDVEIFEGFGVDNIYLEGKASSTYYRFQCIFEFESLPYYDKATLYINGFTGADSSNDLDFRIGNPATNLVGDNKYADFNVDVSAYMGGNMYLDIRDDYRTGDTGSTPISIDRLYIKFENTAPTTPTFGAISNLVSGKVLAEYNYVTHVVTAIDVDSYADLYTVEYSMYNDARTVEQWSILWTQSSDSFAEYDSGGNIVLGDCGSSLTGDTATLTFNYTIDFAFSVFSSTDIRAYSIDDSSSTATGWYEAGPGTETRLSFVNENIFDASGTTSRGSVDGTLTASGNCIYFGLTSYYPKDIDNFYVEVVCSDVASSPWTETDYDDSDGSFSMTVYADDVFGLDSYEFNAYQSGTERTAGAVTDTYIADEVVIITTVSDDAEDRLTINANVEIRVTARLAYTTGGEIWLQAGDSVTLDGASMSWDISNSWFDLARSKSTVGMWDYFVNSTSETEYGVTALDLNSQNVEVIFDRLAITFVEDTTSPIGGQPVSIDVTVVYDYDDEAVTSWTMMVTRDDVGWLTKTADFQDTNVKGVHYVYSCSSAASVGGYGITAFTATPSNEVTWQNNAPDSSGVPTFENPTDTDNLYAYYLLYNWRVTVTDVDGYGDITYVEVKVYSDGFAVLLFVMKYDADTTTWSIPTNDAGDYGYYAELDGADCDTSGTSGNTLIMNFFFNSSWGFHYNNFDIRVVAYDDTTSDSNDHGTDWDSIARLDQGDPFEFEPDDLWLDPDEGECNSPVYFDIAEVWYYGTTRTPPAGVLNVSIWTDETGWPMTWANRVQDRRGPLLAGGTAIDIEVTSRSSYYGTTPYAARLIDLVGAADEDAVTLWYGNVDFAESYTTNRIFVIVLQATDDWVNYGDSTTLRITLYYQYGLGNVETGSFSVWDGTQYWQFTHYSLGEWRAYSISYDAVITKTFGPANGTDGSKGLSTINMQGLTEDISWDGVDLVIAVNYDWTVVGYPITINEVDQIFFTNNPAYSHYNQRYASYLWTGDVTELNGSITSFSSIIHTSVCNLTFYGSEISDAAYGITYINSVNYVFAAWDDVVITNVAYYWVQYDPQRVWLLWDSGTYSWELNETAWNSDYLIQAYRNSTEDDWCYLLDNGQCYELVIGPFNTDWYNLNLSINAEVTIGARSFDWFIWGHILDVDILHTIYIENFNIEPTDYYFWITYQTNWNNASITIWDDAISSGTAYGDAIYWSSFEGMHQFARSTIIASHNITILINGSSIAQSHQNKDFSVTDSWWWYNFTYVVVTPASYDCHIVILNNLYELVSFDTFEVYKNDSRIYHDIIQVVSGNAYKITIKNRFGDTVNETIFDDGYEMVVFVNTYSFKFMNWYNGFLRVNVTRGGQTYSEIIMPMEIIEFNLYEATYVFSVDFLNGTTKFSQEIMVTNSTGYVITGDSLTDVFDLVNSVYAMTNQINVTVTSVTNQVLTISIDLDNVNATINSQLIQVLLNVTNTNTTIYDQTISLLAAMQNVNSTLYNQAATFIVAVYNNHTTIYDQTVTILATLTTIGSNITANYISVSADLLAIDSNLYANFTSVAATLSLIDSALLSNFTELTAELLAVNSTIGAQFLSVAATLSMIDSSLLSNFTSVSATLSMIDSALLSNFTELTAELLAVNSTIGTQFLSVSATLSMIDSALLSNFTELTAELLAVNSTIASQFLSVSATLSMLDSSLLTNFTAVSATLSMIDSQLLSNFTSVTATLSAIGSNITSKFLSVSATLSMIDSNLLTNFTSITATLSMIDSQLLSNFTELTAELLAVNSTIGTQFLSVAATLSLLDSSLLSNFTAVSATLSMIDSQLLSNFTSVTSTLSLIGSNITANYLSVAATLSLLDSSLLSNFTSVTATLSAIGTNITTNYLSVVATLSMLDSQLLSNFTNIVSQLLSVNSTIATQFLLVMTNVESLNATMYLIDDPTHLNPLILGYSLSDDYCDFTIVTTWHNASISIYDNDLLRVGPISELLSPIRYPLLSTSGTHNLSVLIDAGADYFWYNISYTVAEIISFEIESWDVTPHFSIENYLECFFDTTWGNATIYVYMNGTLQTSVLEQDGGISFSFWMNGLSGLHQYEFNVTSGSNVITITWDFYLPDWAETALVVRWDLWTYQNNYTLMTLESNWMNCTYYIYLNSSLVATAYVDPVTLNFTREINVGVYNLTIHAYGGSQNYTVQNIRYVVTDAGVTYDYSEVTITGGGHSTYEGDIYQTYNVPEGLYATADVVFVIIASALLVPVILYIVLDKLEILRRLKLRSG